MSNFAASLQAAGTMVIGSVAANRGRAQARRAHSSTPRTDFNPMLAEVIARPYTHFERLREHPVHVNEKLNVWILSRHADVMAAARAHDVMSSASGVLMQSTRMPVVAMTDNPDHDRLRRIIAPAFTPAAVRALEARLHEFVEPGIDHIVSGATVDVVRELTAPLPVLAIAELLGIDRDRWSDFRRWSNDLALVSGIASLSDVASRGIKAFPGILGLRKLFMETLESPEPPRDDVLGMLKAAVQADNMTILEAMAAAILVLFAGNETTTNLLGIILQKLAHDPDLYDTLRADRALIPSAVEEGLRWGNPVQWQARTTLKTYVVDGVEIPPRARVLLLWASANRDPRAYDKPDVFNPERKPNKHLGFGHGAHVCVGAGLARLETAVALNDLFDRVKRIEQIGPHRWSTSPSLSGPTMLPLKGIAA